MIARLQYSAFRARLREFVANRNRSLHGFRLLRYFLLQGPWQPLLIRYHRAHDRNDPLPISAEPQVFNLNVAATVQQLDQEAYAPGFTVPEPLVDALVKYADEEGGKRIDSPHQRCELVRRLAHDPSIVAVARGYLKTEPILLETKIFWAFPNPAKRGIVNSAGIGLFHYDLSDFRALKVYIYLTDVDDESSPHVVIRGSHRRKLWRIPFRFISDEYAQRTYGDRIEVITGKRGMGWFEDVSCYHKQSLGEKPRLVLTIIYSMHRRPEGERAGESQALVPRAR